jgi:hypothetical protein
MTTQFVLGLFAGIGVAGIVLAIIGLIIIEAKRP